MCRRMPEKHPSCHFAQAEARVRQEMAGVRVSHLHGGKARGNGKNGDFQEIAFQGTRKVG